MTQSATDSSRRVVKFIWRFAVFFMVIGLLGHSLWRMWAMHRLHSTLAFLKSQGEPVASEDIKLQTLPDDQNASLDYMAAGTSVNVNSAAWGQFTDCDYDAFRLPLTDAELNTVGTIVAENSAAFRLVTAARNKTPSGWNDVFSNQSMFTKIDFASSRALANLLKCSAFEAHAGGNDHLVMDRMSDELRLADAAEHRPTLIGHLVALGISSFAAGSASEWSPFLQVGVNGLTRDNINQIIHQLQDEQSIDDGIKLSWRTERIAELNTIDDIAHGTGFTSSTANPLTSPTFGYVMRPSILNDERLLALHLHGVMLAEAETDWPAASRHMPHTAAVSAAHPIYHLILGLFLGNTDKAAMVDYRSKAERRLATVALAIRLYAADHSNQLPPNLVDLVPAYLPVLPTNPLTASPILYRHDPPRIYGIGEDGVDHGGHVVDPQSKDPILRHHGDLVVFLQAQARKK